MAIKSYTDIERSKKLVKILPLESADMNWNELPPIGLFVRAFPYKHDNGATEGIFPCWSLAALISILPRFIKFKGDKYYLRFMKEYVEYANDEISITGRCLHTIGNNNLVDACYEMILKLHEQKLL